MKLRFTSIFLIVLLILNLSTNLVSYAQEYDSADYTIERIDRSCYKPDGDLLLEQYYDKVVLEPVNENYVKINKLIDKYYNDLTAKADEVINEAKTIKNIYNETFYNYYTADVTNNSKGILSICLTQNWYLGGVTDGGSYGLNFNLNKGEILSLTDVFSMSEYQIEQYFKEQVRKYFRDMTSNTMDSGIQSAIDIVDSYSLDQFKYYIEGNMVYLSFAKYEIGPGAMGPVIVPCPIINDKITVTLDGEEVEFDQQPIMAEGDRVMVPIRSIFEKLGYDVYWNGETQTAIARKNDDTVTVQINNPKIYRNNQMYLCDVEPQIISDRTLVPVRAVSELLDCNVEWDGNNKTVIIKTK